MGNSFHPKAHTLMRMINQYNDWLETSDGVIVIPDAIEWCERLGQEFGTDWLGMVNWWCD